MTPLIAALMIVQAAPPSMPAPGPLSPESLSPGTVTVAPLAADQGPAEVRNVVAAQVERALSDAGFLALPAGGRGRYTARVTITRTPRGAVTSNARERRADPVVGNWGAGLSVTMPSGKRQLRGLIVTELRLELIRRGETAPAWTARAATAQAEGTAADDPSPLAATLAAAALRQFPAQSDAAISVP